MSELNKFPPGLLAIFNQQTLGSAPADTSDELILAFDATRLYTAFDQVNRIITTTVDDTTGTGMSAGFLTVPVNQVWLVDHASINVAESSNIPTAAGFLASMALQKPGASGALKPLTQGISYGATYADNYFSLLSLNALPLVALPGDVIGIFVYLNTLTALGGGMDLTAQFSYSPYAY